MRRTYILEEKPDPLVCPREFCFFWRRANWRKRISEEERLSATEGECMCDFGLCVRLDPERGDADWYEPDEPDLERAGLPWFYFIPAAEHLIPRNRERYIAKSEALWGPRHWECKSGDCQSSPAPASRGDEPTSAGDR